MQAGELDRRIRVEAFAETGRTEMNEPIGAWVDHCTVWASRRDQTDAESIVAAANGSALTARFTVRADESTRLITPAMRLVDGPLTWNIKGVLHPHNQRRAVLVLLAVADSGAGNP